MDACTRSNSGRNSFAAYEYHYCQNKHCSRCDSNFFNIDFTYSIVFCKPVKVWSIKQAILSIKCRCQPTPSHSGSTCPRQHSVIFLAERHSQSLPSEMYCDRMCRNNVITSILLPIVSDHRETLLSIKAPMFNSQVTIQDNSPPGLAFTASWARFLKVSPSRLRCQITINMQ